MSMNGFIRILAAAIASTLLCAGGASGAGSIELRSAARVEPGAVVTLADVATLDGEEALALGDIVVIDAASAGSAGAWATIDLATIRQKLSEHGVNWGRIALGGAACSVRFGVAQQAPAASSSIATAPAAAPAVIDLSGPPTLRKRIARALAGYYGSAPEDLQLLFEQRDDELLDRVETGRRVEVHPEASPSSGRMPLTVRIYERMRIVEERSVRVDVRVRQRALVLTADLRRGEVITGAHLREDSLWLAPGPLHLSEVDSVVGSKARTRLAAGTTLRSDHIESPVVVRRNELITVKCLSGSVVLTAKARATCEARIGDVIEMRLDGGSRTFLARVDGPGRAVANMDSESTAHADALAAEKEHLP